MAAPPPDPEPNDTDTATAPPPPPTPPPPPSSPSTATPTIASSAWSPALDPRSSLRRPVTILTTESQALERLLAATQATAPDRPQIIRRIAETYVELRKGGVAQASAKAIASYEQLLRDHPNATNIDEARYYLGLEQLVTSDLMRARKTFYDLIKSSPQSKYVPYAYFAFGEVFFQEAKSDPSKLDFAHQAYLETLKYAQSPVAPEAAFQLYRVAKAKGDTALATKMRALLASQYASSAAAARARAQP